MKTKYVMLSLIFSGITLFSLAQAKSDTIKVWGNCGMCKTKIEKAAMSAGATAADWSEETKLLVVSYDASKTSNTGIQKKVAAVGYDTQDVKAKDGDYKKLDKCCQYNRSGNSAKSIDSIPANCCQGIENCTKDGCCKAGMTCCKDKADKADCCANGKCKSGNK